MPLASPLAMIFYEEYDQAFDLTAGAVKWLTNVGVLLAIGFVVGYVVAIVRAGSIVAGLRRGAEALIGGVREIALLPLGYRRVWAIARLSFKEAVRRRVLYVFVLFLFPFLFAGWYLAAGDQPKLLFFVAFVMGAITWLLLPLIVLVVSMSLPNDLKSQTIYTVATKPVYRLEILIGRILGFLGIFTLVLIVMGAISLAFLSRQIVDASREWRARAPIYATAPGDIITQDDGHSYPLMFTKNGFRTRFGVNVGKEWNYRGHIEGQTSEEARWFFRLDPAWLAANPSIPFELTFDIFKTTKGRPTTEGDKLSGVWCSLTFIDRETKKSFNRTFRVDNFRTMSVDQDGRPLVVPSADISSGNIEVIAQCLTRNQFIGMNQRDLYFLAGERSFAVNFAKGLFGVWLKALLLICVAVSASSILDGFVTALFTSTVYILGLCHSFLLTVARREAQGGGPMEALIRVATGATNATPLDQSATSEFALAFDNYSVWALDKVALAIPDLSTLDMTEWVAQGFDIPLSLLASNFLIVTAYATPVVLIGFFLFRSRELAA